MSYFSPIVSSSHTLLIDGPIQFLCIRKDGLMVDDDGLDDLVDMGLAGNLILAVWCGHECGAEAYGQVVRVHHVLITVLGQAEGCEVERKSGTKRRRQVLMRRGQHWRQYFTLFRLRPTLQY